MYVFIEDDELLKKKQLNLKKKLNQLYLKKI